MAKKRTYKRKPIKRRRNSRKNKVVKQSRKFLGGYEEKIWGLYQVTGIDPVTREPKFTLLEISNNIEKFNSYKNDETYKIEQLNNQYGGFGRSFSKSTAVISSIEELPDGDREGTNYVVEYKPFPNVITRKHYTEPNAVKPFISQPYYMVYKEVDDIVPNLFTRTTINSIDELPPDILEGTKYKINMISSGNGFYVNDPNTVKKYLLEPNKYRVYKDVMNSLSDMYPKN